jgi:hypothetical protein
MCKCPGFHPSPALQTKKQQKAPKTKGVLNSPVASDTAILQQKAPKTKGVLNSPVASDTAILSAKGL